MNRILIETVDKSAMRPPYNQQDEGGDWFINDDGDLVIRAIGVNLDDPEAFLFCLHELVEAYLCRYRGISQQAVDEFDRKFAAEPVNPDYPWTPLLDGNEEPGDHPASPYRREHRQAMLIEHLMANFLGFDAYGKVE